MNSYQSTEKVCTTIPLKSVIWSIFLLTKGDCDGVVFSLLSNSAVSYMVIPFDIFESAQAAHVEGIQSIAITDGQVPCL